MQKVVAVLLTLLAASSAFAQSNADEVRASEIAFAKAFADRDSAKFFSFVLDESSFLPAGRTLGGKAAIVEVWSRFFAAPVAPFSWSPERVVTNAAGTIGISSGPVFDTKGRHSGNFSSVWVQQQDGSWKVLFDGPGSQSACLAENVEPFTEGDVVADDGVKLHYQKIGSSPRTLIVPYGAMLFEDFRALADVATIISYDPRNRGRSASLDNLDSVTIQQDVLDFEAVRRHFNVDRVIPVGWSYLGKMVAMYASAHPEHVARVVQLAPVTRNASLKFTTHTNDDSGVAANAPTDSCAAAWDVASHRLVGDPSHASRLRSTCNLPNEAPARLDKHFAKLWPSIAAVDLVPADLAKIAMPVLTIHGTFDRNAPYDGGREWALTLPNARLLTVPHAAHAVWIDEPALVFAAIRQFLRGEWPLGVEKVGNAN
jgi:pimeloyl-ACP methyl ester carboxylesterase/ketosteroid isomerase-like protein